MKTFTYALYRVGSNGQNQPGRHRKLVAQVEAASQADAIRTEFPRGAAGPFEFRAAVAVLAPEVTVWANQRLEAVPWAKASKTDVREFMETAQ